MKDHQENVLLESTRRENEELKQKLQAIETELLTLKSTQSHRQDLQVNIERLQTEIDHGVRRNIFTLVNMTFLSSSRSKNEKRLQH